MWSRYREFNPNRVCWRCLVLWRYDKTERPRCWVCDERGSRVTQEVKEAIQQGYGRA